MMPVCFYYFATYKLFTTVLSELYIDYIHLQSADNGDWGSTRTHFRTGVARELTSSREQSAPTQLGIIKKKIHSVTHMDRPHYQN